MLQNVIRGAFCHWLDGSLNDPLLASNQYIKGLLIMLLVFIVHCLDGIYPANDYNDVQAPVLRYRATVVSTSSGVK